MKLKTFKVTFMYVREPLIIRAFTLDEARKKASQLFADEEIAEILEMQK